ncbi:MAG: tetratricopeptide repeat protein [Saprospiraceae bacterium]|nr:tetratricopeptide repeat protein [Saprospiraceae bacterium]
MKIRYFLNISVLFLCLFAFNSAVGKDSSVDELFKVANDEMMRKDYAQAIASYETLLNEKKINNVAVYYNLGVAHYYQKNIAKSILYYEKALSLAPRNKDIKNNLEVTRTLIATDIPTAEAPYVIQLWFYLRRNTSIAIAAILQILLIWSGTYFMFKWIWSQQKIEKKRSLSYALLSYLASFILLIWCFYINHYSATHPTAIVMKECSLRHAADSDSEAVVDISEGIKVVLLDRIGDWYKVTLPNGEQGWIESSQVAKI